MTIDNRAAWQRQPGEPLTVGPTEAPVPGHGEILVRNAAVAINPLDYILQDMALLPWLDYPLIAGSDVAGTVVAVGEGVDRFAVGDRVLGQAVGTTVNAPSQGAFQQHTIVLAHMAAPIPDDLPATHAAVLPLGLGTAASGLYQAGNLGLRPPSDTPRTGGETLLVWGASSSVGCNAVQLATASGYVVFATASPRNAAMVRALGAVEVLDHGDARVVELMVAALRGRTVVGAFHATGDLADTVAVMHRVEGRRLVATTLPPQIQPPETVEIRAIAGTSLRDDEVGPMIYRDYLPAALASGRYVAAPAPRIVGRGLEAFQPGLDLQRAGVSGTKLVVDLS
ncbi:oxidoreductase [Brevundimonas sp. LM2]|uniref:zinc-binding alcohol dehydrogenase family protein n=1 Tax=Brevundimonas sp. LM2 TaxID=1938605 RepID=UPI0009839804|nr:zinc-binding alcohol dehydrogenase family protein [Brevundimonas sp. LM2]AQR60341.1 oxidoreductase [Brevundimonas sp. LM2]